MQQHVREVQGSVPLLVQSVVQSQTHAIMAELQAVQAQMDRAVQSQFKEVYALVQSLTPLSSHPAQEQEQEHPIANGQESGQASRGSKRGANLSITLVHSSPDETEHEQGSEPLEQRIKRYILEQRRQGSEPSLAEIMDRCTCSKGSAIRYRRELGESSAIDERRVVGE